MQEYNFKEIESKWQKYWQKKETYKVDEDYKKEKFSSQFVFKNPNETERCGCGESFKI